MACRLEVSANRDMIKIVRQCGPTLKNVLRSKFGCTADFLGMDSAPEPGSGASWSGPPKTTPEKRFHVQLRDGLEVTVWKADLTAFPVDAVVNAANNRLDHCGGLAYALSKAGGPDIQKESDAFKKDHFSFGTGDAAVTNAGLLPCKKIIHAVGPCLPSEPTEKDVSLAEPLLEKAVQSVFHQAARHSLKSVAIPALSSGLFNFPLARCADVIVATVKRHAERREKGSPPTHVHLVNHDEPSVREMERACREKLSRSPSPSIQISTLTVKMQQVTLTLRKGKIEEQETDVIVNTTTENLDLSVGAVSKAISQRAGKRMQQEMEENAERLQHRRLVFTQPYGLRCKEVFHILWASEATREVFFPVISECLAAAASRGHTSIAFPAVGTGSLGLRKRDVAQTMALAVKVFAVDSLKRMDVDVVIYPTEDDTFMSFEAEMRTLQLDSSPPRSWTGRESPSEAAPPPPQIRLSAASREAAREAARWLGTLSSSVSYVIRNNFVQYFGVREFQRLQSWTGSGLVIQETFENGNAGMTVRGEPTEEVVAAGLRVEEMLCAVQEEFAREAELAMSLRSTRSVSHEAKPVDSANFAHGDEFRRAGLQIVRVDRVENPALRDVFELKRKQLELRVSPRQMYQRVPAQFCEMVSHIGFQREYAPPEEAAFGEGIYFARSVGEALKVWAHQAPREEFLYFVQAQVQTGNSTPGRPDLILPPPVGDDPLVLYDSLTGGPGVSVVFSGHQALPEYIVVCEKPVD